MIPRVRNATDRPLAIIGWAIAICAVSLACTFPAAAQQAKKIPRIVFLHSGTTEFSKSANLNGFQQGLRELGYVEGKTINIEYRFAEGKIDQLPALAAEIVRSRPDVIVTAATVPARALKDATNVIPIVVASAGDMVGRGLVASLARPGSNITGSTSIAPDLSGKRLELLKEIVPGATRAVMIHEQYEEDEYRQTVSAGQVLAVHVLSQVIDEKIEFSRLFQTITSKHADALLISNSNRTGFHQKEILALAAANRLPTMCEARIWAERGCLISYAPNRQELFRRAATFVDKILKGRKPADLPVEQPMTFELVINMKTAKQLGITIPPSVMVRAEHIIQ